MENFIGESDSNTILNEGSEEDGFNYFGNSEQNYDAGSDSCYEEIPSKFLNQIDSGKKKINNLCNLFTYH